jgi:chemotaxis protein CheD
MNETIVDVADMKLSKDKDEVLVAPSLGACIAISVHDATVPAGGMLIFMLPELREVNFPGAANLPFMFGDMGIPAFLDAAYQFGIVKERMKLVLAGGGQLAGQTQGSDIGERNCQIAKKILTQAALNPCQAKVGGAINRTLALEIGSGLNHIRIAGQGMETL